MIESENLILLSKIHLPTIVTLFWIPPRESVKGTNPGNKYMTSTGSYPFCYSNTLYESLNCGFTFYFKKCNAIH